MQKAFTTQSSLDGAKALKNSSLDYSSNKLDSRAKMLHLRLLAILRDDKYDLGHVYKLIRSTLKFSDYEILSAAEYCARKANNPGRAFVGLFEKKMLNK